MIVTFQPVGTTAASVLERIGSELAPFGEVRIANPKPLPSRPFGHGSKRYRAATFGRVCRSSDGDRVIAITDVELCDPELGLRLAFGQAVIQGESAVTS